jgi:hypothetical protein
MGNGSGGRDPTCPQRQHRLVRVLGGLVVVTNVRDLRWGFTHPPKDWLKQGAQQHRPGDAKMIAVVIKGFAAG